MARSRCWTTKGRRGYRARAGRRQLPRGDVSRKEVQRGRRPRSLPARFSKKRPARRALRCGAPCNWPRNCTKGWIWDLPAPGLITYMRTDSTNISVSAQQAARERDRRAMARSTCRSARLCIHASRKGPRRPTKRSAPQPASDPASVKAFLTTQQFKLYQLIWQRFMASQTRPAILDQTGVDVAAGPDAIISAGGTAPYVFRATGSVVKFPGFMAVYQAGRDEGDAEDELEKGALPQLSPEKTDLLQLLPEQRLHAAAATLHRSFPEGRWKSRGRSSRPSTYA